MGVDQLVERRHRNDLNGAPGQNKQLAPYHSDNMTSVLQTAACSAGVKTGYWVVGCYVDKNMDPNRVWYNKMTPEFDRKPMTPKVCFDFCKIQYGMRYFFLGDRKDGDGCSCGRYYAKSVKGDMGQCDHPCAGDTTLMCGGHYKETTYQMHDCKAAMRKPQNPWEHMGVRVELAGPDGVKFFTGSDEVPLPAEVDQRFLVAVVLDPHDAFVKTVEAFNIEGLPKAAGMEKDVDLARKEGERFEVFVGALLPLDIVLLAFNSRANLKDVLWGAEVEEALRSMGCPSVAKPRSKFGYAAVCAAGVDSPQSEVLPEGHIAGYIYNRGNIESDITYMIDCETAEYRDAGECSVTCGGGQQFQTRFIVKAPANGGKECPEDMERYVPCNPDPCPIDCEYSEWSGYGECLPTCGPGSQFSRRSVVVEAKFGGVACDEEIEKERSCTVGPCPIDCVMGEWKAWSACDSKCGEGNQERKRNRKVLPKFGGKDCEGSYIEEQSCLVRPCPIDCAVGEWKS
jgi:hypothetical protein